LVERLRVVIDEVPRLLWVPFTRARIAFERMNRIRTNLYGHSFCYKRLNFFCGQTRAQAKRTFPSRTLKQGVLTHNMS
jgi:hypothetical protein